MATDPLFGTSPIPSGFPGISLFSPLIHSFLIVTSPSPWIFFEQANPHIKFQLYMFSLFQCLDQTRIDYRGRCTEECQVGAVAATGGWTSAECLKLVEPCGNMFPQ